MNIGYEFAYALRMISRKMGFSVLCVVVIALGFAITIPLYSIVKNFAYATLPFPDSERWVIVSQMSAVNNNEMTTSSFDQYQFNSLQGRARTLDSLSAFYEASITLSDGDYSERFFGGYITAEALSYASTNPLLGRSIQPGDETVGASPVVLLSYSVWQNYYGGDPDIVGQTGRVNQEAHTIIGVMPQGFSFPQSAEAWLPLVVDGAAQPGVGPRMSIFGKLATGVSRAEASGEFEALVEQQSADFPDIYSNRTAKVIPFTHGLVPSAFTVFNSMAGMALCIYLLVCLNVGNLLLIRANDRLYELGIRTALGSSRPGLFLTILLESLIICSVGASVGVLLASGSLGSLQAFANVLFPSASTRPFWLDFGFNLNVLGVVVALMLSLWLVSGAFAAWRITHKDVVAGLGQGAARGESKESGRVNKGLVSVQVILSFFLLLLSGSYLLVFQSGTTRYALEDQEDFLSGIISLNSESYAEPQRRESFRTALRQLILQDRDFADLSFSAVLPGNGYGRLQAFDGLPAEGSSQEAAPVIAANWVDSQFFAAYSVPVLAGRAFDEFDTAATEAVVIVDSAFISSLGLDEAVVGSSLFIRPYPPSNNSTEAPEQVRIVGVVPYLGPDNAQQSLTPRIYRPLSQDSPATFRLIGRIAENSSTEYSQLVRKLKVAASGVDRDVAIYNFDRVSAINARDTAFPRLLVNSLTGVALGALILATIGVYGLISRAIYARQAEIGVRRALGSSNAAVVSMFLSQAGAYLLAGILLGGGSAVLLLNALGSGPIASGLGAAFSTVFILVTVVVAALILLASYIPTRRVVAMEPGAALHCD